jgi:lysophospholipase L1-like esterase
MTRSSGAPPCTLTLILVAVVAAQAGCGSERSGSDGETVASGSGGNSEAGREGAAADASFAGGGAWTGGSTTGGAWTGGASSWTGGASSSTGGATETGGTSDTGGTSTGGAVTGGAGGHGTGGSVTGGVTSAGAPAGGDDTGGASTGGRSSGGSHTGGASSGGGRTGGTAAGGSATGGATATGGSATGGSATGGTGPLSPVTIYIASDSTASTYTDTASPNDQAGWGQMLPEVFSNDVTVVNKAAGGRTARWFYLEGGVDSILKVIQPGDYLFVQFGTNDGNETATFTVNGTTYPRYAAPDTDFKTYLEDYYVTPVRGKDGTVVFVTPPPRNSAYCGKGNSLAGYAKAMRELGAAEDVAVLDLNAKTFDYLAAICPSPTPEDFFFVRTDGSVDGTHFQENGARHLAGFIAECIRDLHLPLEGYLRP